jgi:hypothetical protein
LELRTAFHVRSMDQKGLKLQSFAPKIHGAEAPTADPRSGTKSLGLAGTECPNHSVCQKKKAENECFKASVRQRFGSILKQWKIGPLKEKIIEIIELILENSKTFGPESKDSKTYDVLYLEDPLDSQASGPGKSLYPCKIIHQINDHNKIQFYKINFFIESLEKSRISPIHIHRIQIFLQTRIFDHLPIQDFFEQMLSVESLYVCRASDSSGRSCTSSAPVDTDLAEISKNFYIHMPTICKTCYHKTHIQKFTELRSKDASRLKGVKDSEEINILRPMAKMYLCMKCGEDNYVNFYERNKSKCRFCILAEKRGLDAEAILNVEHKLAPSASKSHHCKHCHTEDPKNFREGYKSLCYACYLNDKKERDRIKRESSQLTESKGLKEYFCKDCETDLPFRFRRGYKTQCYECFLNEKKESFHLTKDLRSGTKSLGLKESSKQSFKTEDKESKISELLSVPSIPSVSCKHCSDTNSRNFNIGMQSICARCEELESESYICKTCNLECLRNCFSEAQLSNPPGERICNLCDPEAIAALAIEKARKTHKCELCNESRPEEFYSGSKGKCKACIKEERKWKYRTKGSDGTAV